jgi:anti-sigma B factor antagonist
VFSYSVVDTGNVHPVRLRGELDLATAGGLADWLVTIAGSTVVVDLSDLAFLDCRGLGALVEARNRIDAQGDPFVLTHPAPVVRRMLEVLGLDELTTDSRVFGAAAPGN